MPFKGEIHSMGTSMKFAFVTCIEDREGRSQDMYLPANQFTGCDFQTLEPGDIITFEDYGRGGGKNNTVHRAKLLTRGADLPMGLAGAPSGPSRPSTDKPGVRNPHKESNFVEAKAWSSKEDPKKKDMDGCWVGSCYIPRNYTGTGAPDGPKGVPSKEMLLALARGDTDVDKVKEVLLAKEGRKPAPMPVEQQGTDWRAVSARARAAELAERRSRSRSRGRGEAGAAAPAPALPDQGPAVPDKRAVVIPYGGDAAAAAVLSCRDIDEARQMYKPVVEAALSWPGSPGEAAFREYWTPGTQHHESLRKMLANIWNKKKGL